MSKTVVIAEGDGIGPEIMEATLTILNGAKVPLNYETVVVGQKVYESGVSSGIDSTVWETLAKYPVFLKAPITTPQGAGVKSLNVTMRKTLGLFANVRPTTSFHPYVKTNHPQMDVIIVRENEEDLYAGIEHRQTQEVFQCLKLISRPGSERIIGYAFELAKALGRKKVTCMSKDNIMKITDGLFHKTFDKIAKEYPDVETDHMIIDIGTARVANCPERYDVIVTPNLYGDIISDVVAEISGSVGLGGSANIGETYAMFEAIHGSAPDIAGKQLANPSGLIKASVLMLHHLNLGEHALAIENAWLKTIEDGVHTGDIYSDLSTKKVGTLEFAKEVVSRLGDKPKNLKASSTTDHAVKMRKPSTTTEKKDLVGVDAFICEDDRNPNHLGDRLRKISENLTLGLEMISNRGVKVYPDGNPATFCTDHWRCRFTAPGKNPTGKDIIELLTTINNDNLEVIKTENLYTFDGQPGYSLGQGQ